MSNQWWSLWPISNISFAEIRDIDLCRNDVNIYYENPFRFWQFFGNFLFFFLRLDPRQFLRWQCWLEKSRDYWVNSFPECWCTNDECRIPILNCVASMGSMRSLRWQKLIEKKTTDEIKIFCGSKKFDNLKIVRWWVTELCHAEKERAQNRLWQLSRMRWQKSLSRWVANFS